MNSFNGLNSKWLSEHCHRSLFIYLYFYKFWSTFDQSTFFIKIFTDILIYSSKSIFSSLHTLEWKRIFSFICLYKLLGSFSWEKSIQLNEKKKKKIVPICFFPYPKIDSALLWRNPIIDHLQKKMRWLR